MSTVLVIGSTGQVGRVVVEDYLDGPEVSLFCLSDGATALPLVPIHYTHPARVKRFRAINIVSVVLWIFACGALVALYPVQPLWLLIVFWVGGGWFMISGFIRTATGEDE